MSEEMAVSDNTTVDEAKVSNDEATTATVAEPEEAAVEVPIEPVVAAVEEPPAQAEEDPAPDPEIEENIEKKPEVKEEPQSDDLDVPLETPEADIDIKKEEDEDVKDLIETFEHNIEEDLKRGIKRRASSAFSDVGDEEFKGFDDIKLEIKAADYCRVLERLEAEVTAASKDLVPLRTVMATPPAPGRASKRARKDTEGSRPSSALSSRSEGDGATDVSPERNKLKNIKENKRNKFRQTEEVLTKPDQRKNTEKEVNRKSENWYNDVLSTKVQDGLSDETKKSANSVLGIYSEDEVVKWIKSLTKCGFPLSKVMLNLAAMLVKENENRTPETDPAEIWCHNFLRKHPELRFDEPEGIGKASEAPRDSLIRKWFENLQSYLSDTGITDIMKGPTRIYNADETRFPVAQSGKVLAPKCSKNISKENDNKKFFTVFIMMNASGNFCPPLQMYPSKNPPLEFAQNMPNDWYIGRNKSGQMSKEILYEYIANGFNNWLEKNEVKKPVIVFLDGQKSYKSLSMPLSQFCEENGIILYSLPSNTGGTMQPSEISVFRPLKQEWKQTVRNWQAKPENLNKAVTKINFPKVLKDILDSDMTKAIKNGFRKCGLFPFDKDAVDFQERRNQRCVDLKDFQTAIKVISLMKVSLRNKGIDPDIVINAIESAQSSFKVVYETENL